MNNLIDRGLIECVGRLDVPGRPMQYGTTSDFLRCFGIDDISQLPPTSEELVDMFKKVKSDEENVDENADQITMDLQIAEENASELHNEDDLVGEQESADNAYIEHTAEDDIVDIDD